MPGYPGSVGLTGYIAPADTLDTYALQSEVFNRGGYRTVADATERDDITADRRKLGMLVFCLADNTFYTLKTGLTNTDWEVADVGGAITGKVINDNVTNLYDLKVTDRVLNIKAFDNSSNLEIRVDGANGFPNGYTCLIVDDWRTGDTGNSDTGIFNMHGYNGVSFRTLDTVGTNIFNVYPKDALLLTYAEGIWFINKVEKPSDELPNNDWSNHDDTGIAYLQPTTTAQAIPVSGIVNAGAFTKASGDGVADYILPTINYYNYQLYGNIYLIRHSSDNPVGTYENVRILPDSGASSPDKLYNAKFIQITEVTLKPGETAIFQSIYDDPQYWIYIGKIGEETTTNAEHFEDIPSNSSTDIAGYYFMYGDDTELELTSNATNRVFNIKCVNGNSIIKTDTGIVDGINQSILLNAEDSITIVAKEDDTYHIFSQY